MDKIRHVILPFNLCAGHSKTSLSCHHTVSVVGRTHQNRIFKAKASTVGEARVDTGCLACNSQPPDFVILKGLQREDDGVWTR